MPNDEKPDHEKTPLETLIDAGYTPRQAAEELGGPMPPERLNEPTHQGLFQQMSSEWHPVAPTTLDPEMKAMLGRCLLGGR